MSVIRLVMVGALIVTLGSQQLSTCAGWASSARARMACCEQRADCDHPSMSDACCAAGEQDENAQIAFVGVQAPARIAVFVSSPADPGETGLPNLAGVAPSSCAHLLNTVLLI